MAHNINENNRVFTVGQAWHGLGTVVETEQTAESAIKLAKLDYKVDKEEVFTKDRLIGNLKAVVRQDTKDVLGIVTDKYRPIQNVEAFSFFDQVVGDGQAIYHSAGALGKGEKTWILAKLPNDIVIGGEDRVQKYLCLSNSHDGKNALRMYFTPIRVVCQNTLNLSMADAKNGISIRHSSNYKSKIEDARKILNISINYYKQFETIINQFEQKTMTDLSVNSYFDRVLGIKSTDDDTSTRKLNQKNELLNLFESGQGQKLGHKHSLWKAYNAVTEYVDHHRTIGKLKEDPTNKLKNIWFGSGASMKEKAYEEALVLV